MRKQFIHKFVELMPPKLEENVLYISIECVVAIHLCACGCGSKTVTPLSPTGWQLKFDGEKVSLNPSIGNWNFSCRSHYWIRDNHFVFIDDSRRNIKVELKNERKKKKQKKKLIPLIKEFITKKKK